MKNLLIVDIAERNKLIKNNKNYDEFIVLSLFDIVNEQNVLDEIEFAQLYFYFDESMKNKESIQEIARVLEVRQYYILNANSNEDIENIITNAKLVKYGNIKADTLRKNVDLLFQTKISQITRWLLFKHRSADSSTISRLFFKRATPVILGLIAEAEQEIIDFNKENFIRVFVEYIYSDDSDLDKTTNLPKIKTLKLQHRTKFKEEHKEELNITLKALRDVKIIHTVKDIKRNTEERKPFPPLTTTRLQRNCFYLFNIDLIKTLSICEDLCNGILIDGIKTKLITSPFTQGHNISDDAIIEINKALIKRYGIDYVLPSRRTFENIDDDNNEAIRPLCFLDKYFPKRLEGKLPVLHLEIYKFIFYRTLATQMKNSIYDASKLIVEVGEIELIANANKMEFDGWEKLDGYRQCIAETDEESMEKEVVFPQDLFIGKELRNPIINDFLSSDKNPPRYGKGRLLTKIVEEGLCGPEFAHIIIDSMEKAGLIKERQHMIHPQEIGMIANALFKEFSPDLLDCDQLRNFELNVVKVRNEEIEAEEVVHDYEVLKNDFEIAVGYEENNSEPEEWMKVKAKTVAKFHGEILRDDNPIFYSKQMLLSYINSKENELEKIGRCPECKKEQIVEDSNIFKCMDRECKFKLYKSGKDGKTGGISGFFNAFKKDMPEEKYKEILQVLLKSNGKIYFNDLMKSNNDIFKAYVILKKNKAYNKWELSLSFPRSKKAEVSDSLKAENILGDYNQKAIKLDVQDKGEYSLLTIEEFIKDTQIFKKKKILITALCLRYSNENAESLMSVVHTVDNILSRKKVRYKIYKTESNEVKVLLVGEYIKNDLLELGLERVLYDTDIKYEIKIL